MIIKSRRGAIAVVALLLLVLGAWAIWRYFHPPFSPAEQVEEGFPAAFYAEWERICAAQGQFRPPLPTPGVRAYTGHEGDCQGRPLLNKYGRQVCGPDGCLICCTKQPRPR